MKNFNRTQSLEEAIETADEIERKLKECDLKRMTDEEALKEMNLGLLPKTLLIFLNIQKLHK